MCFQDFLYHYAPRKCLNFRVKVPVAADADIGNCRLELKPLSCSHWKRAFHDAHGANWAPRTIALACKTPLPQLPHEGQPEFSRLSYNQVAPCKR